MARPRCLNIATPCLSKMLLQLIAAVCAPLHVGGAAAAKPAPEIDNRFEEGGGKASPGPATKHANTLHSPLRLTLKRKIQNSKRDLDEEPILGQDYQDSKTDLTPKLTQPMS